MLKEVFPMAVGPMMVMR